MNTFKDNYRDVSGGKETKTENGKGQLNAKDSYFDLTKLNKVYFTLVQNNLYKLQPYCTS